MIRTGIDLIEILRIQRAIEQRGERFLARIFTPEELEYCRGKSAPYASYAARFAAKEAFFKSLIPGTLTALIWKEVGVTLHDSGAPSLAFTGQTRERLANWHFALSLTHTRHLAMAQVLATPPGEEFRLV